MSPRKEPRPIPAKPIKPGTPVARVATEAEVAVEAAKPVAVGMNVTPGADDRGPHWKGRGIASAALARKAREAKEKAKPRDYVADAKAAIAAASPDPKNYAPQPDPIIAAIIVAQAMDRLTKALPEVAAIANYKRES